MIHSVLIDHFALHYTDCENLMVYVAVCLRGLVNYSLSIGLINENCNVSQEVNVFKVCSRKHVIC